MYRPGLALLLAAPLFTQGGLAQSVRPYTMLYVFGDSYSDSGAGYIDADGPTAVVYLARRLSIPFTFNGDPHAEGKGLNFAVSGTSTGEGAGRALPTGGKLGFGMKNQVQVFTSYLQNGTIPKFDPAATMFFFAGGLNDGGRPEGFVRANIESEIETLYALGARRFMVADLPVKIPQFARAGNRVNPELQTIPDDLRARHSDIRIALSHWGSFFDEVIAHPAKYGLTDTTSQCADRPFGTQHGPPCATPEKFFFYHEGHPSTAAHRAVGEMLYREATAKLP